MERTLRLSPYLILAGLGSLISAYLLFHDTRVTYGFQIEPSFCSINSYIDCDRVAQSEFAYLLGIPVASYGLIYYLTLLCFLLCVRRWPTLSSDRLASLLIAWTFVTVPPTIYWASVSAAIIKALCLFCLASYLINLAMAIMAARSSFRQGGLVHNFVRGWRDILSFIRSGLASTGSETTLATVSSFAFLALVSAVLFAPSYIVLSIFLPQEKGTREADLVAQAVAAWKRAPETKIALRLNPLAADGDFTLGSSSAPVTIVVFSDFMCPHCRTVGAFLHEWQRTRPLRVVFKNFPLDQSCNRVVTNRFHQFSCQAAIFARCAGQRGPGVFWQAHDALIAQPELNSEAMSAVAKEIGLAGPEFEQCLSDASQLAAIKSDVEEGVRLGIQATPAVFINGKQLKVAQPAAIKAIVEALSAAPETAR